jgi:DnaJ-class molecular chaperone
MNWWKILEIDYESDLKTIKRAYAKLLKENNPEDNPEGYQRIRQAYDAAIKYEKEKKV